MVVKGGAKKRQKARRRAVQVVRGGLTRLKRSTTPPSPPAPPPLPAGVLRPEHNKERVAKEWLETQETPIENPGRLVLVIVLLACLWIAIIAWFVSQMEPR